VLGLFGVSFIIWLVRGFYVHTPVPALSTTPAGYPTTLSDRQPLTRLVWAIGVKLVVDALGCVYSVLQLQQISKPQPSFYHSFIVFTVTVTILYDVPFALALSFVRWRPTRTILAFTLALPAIGIVTKMIALSSSFTIYTSPYNRSLLIFLAIGFGMDVVLVIVAYHASWRTNFQPAADSLATAVAVSVVYFYFLHLITPILRRAVR
jgi:hypothetical protein